MYYIATTRFNNETFSENRNYCERNESLYYGSPIPLKDKLKKEHNIVVLEMNNDENKIMGIGIIKNILIKKKNHQVYKDRNYNRYIYSGNIRIDRNEIIDEYNKKIFDILDMLLFKGSKHIKRAQGITELPEWIINCNFDFKKYFRYLFKKYKNFKIV
tara:strand:- start:12198 stop:12671 length:474 start_codon:yes stop_codon:yes gene_type:complete